MARFIDSDKLIWQVQNNDKYGTITKQVFISLLQNSETEDVAPVIHAHWINHFDDLYPVESTVECSNCHEEQMTLLDNNYCQNCGARMDEEVE